MKLFLDREQKAARQHEKQKGLDSISHHQISVARDFLNSFKLDGGKAHQFSESASFKSNLEYLATIIDNPNFGNQTNLVLGDTYTFLRNMKDTAIDAGDDSQIERMTHLQGIMRNVFPELYETYENILVLGEDADTKELKSEDLISGPEQSAHFDEQSERAA